MRKEEAIQNKDPGERGQPARPLPDPLVVLVQDPDGLGRDLVPLADDDPVLLDGQGHRDDGVPGAGLALFGLDLVVGDVGGQEDLSEVGQRRPAPRGHLDPGQVVVEPALAFADVEQVIDADGPLLALFVDEDDAPLRFAVDEEVLGDDDALAEGLGREADQGLFEVRGELQPDQGQDVGELEIDTLLVDELRPEGFALVVGGELGRPVPSLGEEAADLFLGVGEDIGVVGIDGEDGGFRRGPFPGGRFGVLDGEIERGDDVGRGDFALVEAGQVLGGKVRQQKGDEGRRQEKERPGILEEPPEEGLGRLLRGGLDGGVPGLNLGRLEQLDLVEKGGRHGLSPPWLRPSGRP